MVLQALLELPEQMALPAQVELVDLHIQVLPEQQALPEQMEVQVQLVTMEQLVQLVLMAQLAQRVQALLALQEAQVQQDHKDQLALQVLLV